MTPEGSNFFFRCRNPLFLGRMLFFLCSRALFSFTYRFLPSVWQYPKKIAMALEDVPKSSEREKIRAHPFVPALPLHGRVKLAAGFLAYDSQPDWRERFDDAEQTMSLHRWNWLLFEHMSLDAGIHLMRSWLSVMGEVPHGVGGTPYTTGERVVSAIMFFQKHAAVIPEDIGAALRAMARSVARRVEYHGARATGNHVLNNARALFFAGQVLADEQLSTLALRILEDALPKLVTEDGFLREESSHYHLLVTRWVLDIADLAKRSGHRPAATYLEPWVQMLAEKCRFFFVSAPAKGSVIMPLIGDVSPDCTPTWLLSYMQPHLVISNPRQCPKSGMQGFANSGWFRLDWGALTMFWHIPQTNMIHRPHHGHGDATSFVLFYQGQPVLIDPGRPTYQTHDPFSVYSVSARAHNAVTVDGFDPFVYDKQQRFPGFYQDRNVQIDWSQEGERFFFWIEHSGCKRIRSDAIKHVRRFVVRADRIEIEDEFTGRGVHTVETFFQWAPELSVDHDDSLGFRVVGTGASSAVHATFRVESSAEAVEVRHDHGQTDPSPNGWVFPSYGDRVPTTTTVVTSRTRFPYRRRYSLTWE